MFTSYGDQTKSTDFLKILAWASHFKLILLGALIAQMYTYIYKDPWKNSLAGQLLNLCRCIFHSFKISVTIEKHNQSWFIK